MQSIWQLMVLEHDWRSTITHPPSIQMEFLRQRGSGSRSVGMRWGDMILPGVEDARNCVDPQNLWKREWDQKLGKIECVFWLYDKMRRKWDDVNILRGLQDIYSCSQRTSVTPVSLFTRNRPLKMYLEDVIERASKCTLRPASSE
jgi:hypothetical protein